MHCLKTKYLCIAFTLSFAVSACVTESTRSPNTAMDRKLSATTEYELSVSLTALETELSDAQLEELKTALGALYVTDLSNPTRLDFIVNQINGQSPRQLIEAAKPRKQVYGMK